MSGAALWLSAPEGRAMTSDGVEAAAKSTGAGSVRFVEGACRLADGAGGTVAVTRTIDCNPKPAVAVMESARKGDPPRFQCGRRSAARHQLQLLRRRTWCSAPRRSRRRAPCDVIADSKQTEPAADAQSDSEYTPRLARGEAVVFTRDESITTW